MMLFFLLSVVPLLFPFTLFLLLLLFSFCSSYPSKVYTPTLFLPPFNLEFDFFGDGPGWHSRKKKVYIVCTSELDVGGLSVTKQRKKKWHIAVLPRASEFIGRHIAVCLPFFLCVWLSLVVWKYQKVEKTNFSAGIFLLPLPACITLFTLAVFECWPK
ncbi:hypothetical protein V8C26DRAFT_19294 [Trichoderma gracile]